MHAHSSLEFRMWHIFTQFVKIKLNKLKVLGFLHLLWCKSSKKFRIFIDHKFKKNCDHVYTFLQTVSFSHWSSRCFYNGSSQIMLENMIMKFYINSLTCTQEFSLSKWEKYKIESLSVEITDFWTPMHTVIQKLKDVFMFLCLLYCCINTVKKSIIVKYHYKLQQP